MLFSVCRDDAEAEVLTSGTSSRRTREAWSPALLATDSATVSFKIQAINQ